MAPFGGRLRIIEDVDNQDEDRFVVVSEVRDRSFLMQRVDRQILQASLKNDQISKRIVVVLRVLVYLSEAGA
jgi:hypothetical protein